MLITLIFYGSEHTGQGVKISVAINDSVGYKCICGFGDMLIGSEIPRDLRLALPLCLAHCHLIVFFIDGIPFLFLSGKYQFSRHNTESIFL